MILVASWTFEGYVKPDSSNFGNYAGLAGKHRGGNPYDGSYVRNFSGDVYSFRLYNRALTSGGDGLFWKCRTHAPLLDACWGI